MNRIILYLVAACIVTSEPLRAQLSSGAAIAKCEMILKNLQSGRAGEVVKEFDATMTQGLPEDRLKSLWPSLIAKFGAFKSIQERRDGTIGGMQGVELILSFEKQSAVQRVLFDKDGKVAGLFFQSADRAILPAKAK